MQEKPYRIILYYKRYYLDFFEQLPLTTQKKFNWTLLSISTVERVPSQYFEHLTNTTGLYEIRVESGSNIYRVFCFFDKGNLIILTNGFHKKTQKTPKKEIERAERIKQEYFNEKAKK